MHLIISYFAYMNLFICSDKSGKPMAMLMFKLLAADHILELTSLFISVIMGSVVVFFYLFFFFFVHFINFLSFFFSFQMLFNNQFSFPTNIKHAINFFPKMILNMLYNFSDDNSKLLFSLTQSQSPNECSFLSHTETRALQTGQYTPIAQ